MILYYDTLSGWWEVRRKLRTPSPIPAPERRTNIQKSSKSKLSAVRIALLTTVRGRRPRHP